MSRPALSARRALSVLGLLAANPARPFNLSEIASHTQMGVSTCHAILGLLEEQGFLVRHPKHKTYRLGAALTAMGEAAATFDPLLGGARQAAKEVARETGLEVVLAARAGDDLIGVAKYAETTLTASNLRVGQRLPLRPPIGGLFMAWGSKEEMERWIAPDGADTPDHLRKLHLRNLKTLKERGFQVTLKLPEKMNFSDFVDHQQGNPLNTEQLDDFFREYDADPYQLDPIEDSALYNVQSVTAPIFDELGRVSFQLGVNLPRGEISGSEIGKIVRQLCEACGMATRSIHTASRFG